MIRLVAALIVFAGATVASTGIAQPVTPPTLKNQSLSLGTGTLDANEFTIRGLTLGNISTAGNSRSVFLGNAGPAGANTGAFSTCVGDGACAALPTSANLEMTAFGTGAAAAVTGGTGYSIAQGVSSLRSDTSANHVACLGGDACRNEIGGGFSVYVGDNSGRNGTPNFDAFLGSATGQGSALILTFGGTITVGHTLTLTLTTSGYATGLPLIYTYLTTSGDTLQSVAQQFYNKINANVSTISCVFTPANVNGGGASNGAIALDFPGTPTSGCAITGALTGNTTETLTVGYSTWTQSVVVGTNAGSSAFALNNIYDVLVGQDAGENLVSSSQDVFIGAYAGENATTELQSVFVGAFAGSSTVNWYNNVYVGFEAGSKINGPGNIIVGAFDNSTAQNCLSGFQYGNIVIGANACPTANASNQLSIGNAVYGLNLDGSVNTVSNSLIGINTKTPNAGLTIGQAGTSNGVTSDGHLGFLAATQPGISTGCTLDATASDSGGTITVASGTTSCTLTYAYPFKTVPHVTVDDYIASTSQTKINTKTTALVTWTVASGAKFDYHVIQ